MKMTKRLFLYLLGLAAFVGLMTSCAKEDKFTQVSSLSFSSTPSSLAPGQTHKLQVKAFPADADEPYTLVFASSKPEVATVDAQGTVTAIKDGQTVISVSLKDRPEVKAEFTLMVETFEITGVEFTQKVDALYMGETTTITAKVLPENATEAGTLEYTSSQTEVATITQTGYITALEAGTTVITATVKEHPEIKAEFTLTVKPLYKAPKNTQFQKVGYFPSYRDLAAMPDEFLQMYTVACYSFAKLNKDYTLTVEKPDKLREFVTRCKSLGIKVLICFGGGGSGADGSYAAMAASPENRAKFITSLKTIVETYDLDGVDNDWEYPRTTDGSDKGNTALMRELSIWLHDPAVNKLLTMAITSGKYTGAVASAIETECFDYVDWFNVMCYDNYLGWANMDPKSLALDMMSTGYNYWVGTRKMPKYKFVGGISAYGRPSDEEHNGTPVSYVEILRQGGSPDGYKAEVSTAKYTGTVYYNGQPFVKEKTRYCIDQGVGGVMFWDAGQDTQDDRSLIQAACDEAGDYTDLP